MTPPPANVICTMSPCDTVCVTVVLAEAVVVALVMLELM